MSRENGISDDELIGLAGYRESPLFSDADKMVLDLAVGMCRTPAQVSDEQRTELLEHFTVAQLTELVESIAWENHRARVNAALGVRKIGFSEGSFCMLPHPMPDAPDRSRPDSALRSPTGPPAPA